ncbi:MAG: M23 family metallopeptidase [Deltaproteobacteria bacterium]|nr:M23 family metallopeptidase [Deltaproteobacteria bacterium]
MLAPRTPAPQTSRVGGSSVLMPAVPERQAAPSFVISRFEITGALAQAVPQEVLEGVDAAFRGRLDLYAHAAPGAKLVTFSQDNSLVGILLITPTHERHLLGRARGLGTEGWFDARGARTDEGPMLARPMALSRVSSRFGERFHPITGQKKQHRGVDYAAPSGTPVWATMDGVVKLKATDAAAGHHIKLRHGTTYESWYLHLDAFAPGIANETLVKRGDVIGFVGTTGASTGPHLHYEMHLGPVVLDPLDLLPSRTSEALPPTALAAHQSRLKQMEARAQDP